MAIFVDQKNEAQGTATAKMPKLALDRRLKPYQKKGQREIHPNTSPTQPSKKKNMNIWKS